jgi:hypothetical protein
MKAFPSFSLKPVLDEILESLHRLRTVPVPVASKAYLSPVEIRRYVRNLRKSRQTEIY